MDKVIAILWIVLLFLFWFLIIKKLVWNRYAPVKTVKAEVVDKYQSNTVTRHPGTFKRERYVVVFKTKNEKLSFDVSEFSYNSYSLKDKGMLRYKGNRIINFE